MLSLRPDFRLLDNLGDKFLDGGGPAEVNEYYQALHGAVLEITFRGGDRVASPPYDPGEHGLVFVFRIPGRNADNVAALSLTMPSKC